MKTAEEVAEEITRWTRQNRYQDGKAVLLKDAISQALTAFAEERVKEALDQECECSGEAHTSKLECLESERDRLKAELEEANRNTDHWSHDANALRLDRDLWKLKAEKMAEALLSLYRFVSYLKDLRPDSLWQMKQAKEALSEFENQRGALRSHSR